MKEILKQEIESEITFLEGIAEMKATKIGKELFYEHDTVDSKTASLLTHVSIMLAVLSIFYSSMKNHPIIGVIASLELLAYLLITIGCLRAIYMVGPAGAKPEQEQIALSRIKVNIARRRSYKISLIATIVVTSIVIPTIISHVILSNF